MKKMCKIDFILLKIDITYLVVFFNVAIRKLLIIRVVIDKYSERSNVLKIAVKDTLPFIPLKIFSFVLYFYPIIVATF